MIYDSFIFFNELELLELRLNLLYDKVDKFIISECDYTFSGLKKPFYFEENINRYQKFLDKIIYIKNTDTIDISSVPEYISNSPITDYGKHFWCREWMQREFVKKGMTNCKDGDIIITSDLDEIPDPNKIPTDGGMYTMRQMNMIYYANWHNRSEVWYGPQILPYSYIKNTTINECRRLRETFNIIDGGWHLTYMGGEDRIKQKIESYSHQEFNNKYTLGNIGRNLSNATDVLNRGILIEEIEPVDIYPPQALSILSKYNLLKWTTLTTQNI